MKINLNKKNIEVSCLITLALFLGAVLYVGVVMGAANPAWLQTQWTSRTSNSTTHVDPSGRNDWTQYSNTSGTYIDTSDGKVKLNTQPNSVVYPNPNSFSTPTPILNNTAVTSGGSQGQKVEFRPAITDPFADNSLQRLIVGSSELPKLAVGKPMVKVNNYIYALFTFNRFGRFEINTKNWEFLADTPAEVGVGSCLAYYPGSNYIYALQGGGTNNFWRYTLPDATHLTGLWESISTPNNPLGSVSYGGSLVAVQDQPAASGGAVLYCLTGGRTTGFFRFRNDGTGPRWSSMTGIPSTMAYGDLIYDSLINRIYAVTETGFYYASLDSSKNPGSWSSSLTIPLGASYGVSLYWPGSGNFIYAFSGSKGEYFSCYDVTSSSSASWQTLTRPFSSNYQLWDGGYRRGLLLGEEVSGTTKLRLLSPSNTNKLYDYVFTTTGGPASGKWTGFVVSTPYVMYGVTQVIHPEPAEYSNYVYVLSGPSYFWRYDAANNKWDDYSSSASLPSPVRWSGTQAVFMRHQDGTGDYIYYAADITSSPGGLYRCKLTSATGLPERVNYVYWNKITPASGSFPSASYYASLGKDDTSLYYLSGTTSSSYTDGGCTYPRILYKYNPVTNGVSSTAVPPPTSGMGVALVLGKGNSLYSMRGSNYLSQGTYGYSPYIYRINSSTGTWYQSAGAPFSFLKNASLSWTPDDPNYVYIKGYIGNSYWCDYHQVFLRYSIPDTAANFANGTWEWLQPPPAENIRGGDSHSEAPWSVSNSYGLTMQGSAFIGKTLYCATGNSDEFLAYNIDTDAWTGKNQIYYNTMGWCFDGSVTGWPSDDGTSLSADTQFYDYYMDRYWVDSVYTYYNGQGVIYQFGAPYKNNGDIIQRYSVNDDKWLAPVRCPFPINSGTRAAYSNGKIYALRGDLTDELWIYDISTSIWSATPKHTGFRIGNSATICGNQQSGANERIYVISGATELAPLGSSWPTTTNAGKIFKAYDPANDEWIGGLQDFLADNTSPGAFMGTAMIFVPDTNKIYSLSGTLYSSSGSGYTTGIFRSFSIGGDRRGQAAPRRQATGCGKLFSWEIVSDE